MLIEVRSHDFALTAALRRHVEQQIESGFSRFGRRITAVVVQLSDINGDHGGEDKSCQILLTLPSRRKLMAQCVHRDMYAAIARAIDKARFTVLREFERRGSRHDRRQSLRRPAMQ